MTSADLLHLTKGVLPIQGGHYVPHAAVQTAEHDGSPWVNS